MSTTIIFDNDTIKRGTGFPQGQRYTVDYDPSRGFESFTDYKGIDQEQLSILQQSIIAQGISCRLVLYEDMGELHVTNSTLEYTIDSWEIAGSDESVDGLSHPTVIGILGDPGNGYWWSQIRSALENNESPDDFYDDMIGDLDNPLSADDASTIQTFYSLQQRGSTQYRTAQYVLRHKTNVSNRWQINVSDVGVETIYTPAQLLSEVTDSSLWIYPLPPRLQFKIGAIKPLAPETNYLWGWLKGSSTESNIANNRVEISTDYTLQLWSVQPDGYYAAFNGDYGSTPYY